MAYSYVLVNSFDQGVKMLHEYSWQQPGTCTCTHMYMYTTHTHIHTHTHTYTHTHTHTHTHIHTHHINIQYSNSCNIDASDLPDIAICLKPEDCKTKAYATSQLIHSIAFW